MSSKLYWRAEQKAEGKGPPEAVSPLEMFAVTFDRALNPFLWRPNPLLFFYFSE